jgi:hypothetical protein
MSSLVLFIVLFLGTMVGMVVGLIICANTDLGDFAFTDTRRDLLKCAVVSMVTAGVGVGLFQLAHNARVFLGLIPIFYLGLKLSWLDISVTDVIVTGGTTILSIAVLSMIAFMLPAL